MSLRRIFCTFRIRVAHSECGTELVARLYARQPILVGHLAYIPTYAKRRILCGPETGGRALLSGIEEPSPACPHGCLGAVGDP